jgi:hypothetical protein
MSGLKKMTDVTFVSALFNIDRVDGRKWDEYLKWFDVTLQLQAPMTLFVSWVLCLVDIKSLLLKCMT